MKSFFFFFNNKILNSTGVGVTSTSELVKGQSATIFNIQTLPSIADDLSLLQMKNSIHMLCPKPLNLITMLSR